ncbi:SDR family oxidoreductase [Oceanobacillus piezotolerans]|uniref:SDR family oxidoreductase n=1 Tax=Oceanobacillus piezotolerans TaxID=2448030 RepID=A0A498D5B9_9BACI|nr:SDR family oxidoreductase [Oceanobacillus piezotolerans]RLL43813.1 SDR family oxidoreductase [Oceanobacillus piezotolerans]
MEYSTVVITGAGSGLGASLAKKFSLLGSHVCLLGRTKKKLTVTASELKGDYSIYEVDVRSKKSVRNVMEEIKHNRGSIDCLINNAGVGIFKYLEELNEEEIIQMLDTNLKGTIFCTQEALVYMREQNKGQIINIVSGSGKVAKETESVYSASKFGVRGFSDAVTAELSNTNIKIHSAYMGNMKTELWEKDIDEERLAQFIDPDDVADIIIDSLKNQNKMYVKDITILNHNY